MALRDQPYIPLYVQDIMTDEKLNECSASTHGIYIKGIMCLMHKSEEYGTILLKQKDKQSDKQTLNFALKLVKHLPYTVGEIEAALDELIAEGVLCYDEINKDKLCQKRMIKDNKLSLVRAKAGKMGGDKSQFAKAKTQATSENEYEDENEDENIGDNKKYKSDSFEIRMSELLHKLILERNPKHKKPNFQKWAYYIDLMKRIDKRSEAEIEGAIRWSQNDNVPNKDGFCWANNILSTDKLRKQYDQIYLRAKNGNNRASIREIQSLTESISNDDRLK